MTAQIDDSFRHGGTDYHVAGISEGQMFDPTLLNLHPVGVCTACWRGYQAVFTVSRTRLVLDTLHVSLLANRKTYEREAGPRLNGVEPTGPANEHDWFNNHYAGLEYHLEYTGGLLLGQGFIQELYIHMGFHPAWKYERVLELIFQHGVLVKESDRSDSMQAIREKIVASRDSGSTDRPDDAQVRRFIERAFDRSYDL